MTTDLAVFDEVTAEMAEYKKENASLEFDYEDPQGNKDARSHIHKLRQAKTKIADIHKVAKAESLAIGRSLDKKKNALTADVNEMIDVHYKPVKEIEERAVKAAAEKANEERLERIRVEAERVAENERREEEIAAKEKALQDKEDALIREKEKLEAAKQAEIDKQAAVKEAQEQAERDKIAAAAQAEQDKKETAELAEREKQEAVEAEKERQRKDAEAAQEEAARLADIERKRVADKTHRDGIEAEIQQAIEEAISIGADNNVGSADALVIALIDGNIPHVTINY